MKFSPLQMKINPDATTKKWKNKITKTKHKQNQKKNKKNKKTNRTVRSNTIHTSSNEKKMIINPDVTEKTNITKKNKNKNRTTNNIHTYSTLSHKYQ